MLNTLGNYSNSVITKLHNVEIYLAPKILHSPEWLLAKNLKEIQTIRVEKHFYFILKYRNTSRFQIYKFNKLLKSEPRYFNYSISNSCICYKFVAKDADTCLFDTIVKMGIEHISGIKVKELMLFISKKASTT